MLRIQFERQTMRPFPSVREYALLYAMNRDRMERAKPDILIMAPGPINRGVEVTPEVDLDPISTELKKSRLFKRKASDIDRFFKRLDKQWKKLFGPKAKKKAKKKTVTRKRKAAAKKAPAKKRVAKKAPRRKTAAKRPARKKTAARRKTATKRATAKKRAPRKKST